MSSVSSELGRVCFDRVVPIDFQKPSDGIMTKSQHSGHSEVTSAPIRCSTRIASVVLNYKGMDDLEVLVPQLRSQTGVRHDIIIVDNASGASQVRQLLEWAAAFAPNVVVGASTAVLEGLARESDRQVVDGRLLVLLNPENRGYSSGNNVGIRIAKELGAEVVLIANPDMRIEDPQYLEGLARTLLADEDNLVAASRIIGLKGEDQNPLVEPRFWEELAWPLTTLLRQKVSYILPVAGKEPVVVTKVSGCCMMLRMSFLQEIGYLDEGVFLYCEESILSAQIRDKGMRIIYSPGIEALHAHDTSLKGAPTSRYLAWSRSRRYYHLNYTDYGIWRRALLAISRHVLILLVALRQWSRSVLPRKG